MRIQAEYAFLLLRERCFKAGVSGYFQKPINIEELGATITKLIGDKKGDAAGAGSEKGKLVLLIDDEQDWRFMASLYLKDAGLEVLTAADGAEALEKIRTTRPDLVLLDLNLAGESGLEVMKVGAAKSWLCRNRDLSYGS